jgi:IrrE N-terminal-like domain
MRSKLLWRPGKAAEAPVRIDQHVARILATQPSRVLGRIMRDPLGALAEEFGLTVRLVEALTTRRGAGGWCDGMSFLEEGVVLIVESPFSRRQNFTGAHELAHLLVDEDDDALDWLADQPDRDRLRETLCDRIAAALLLPAELINRIVGAGPIRAAHLRKFYDASEASEPACAIALATRLPCQGSIVISDIGKPIVTFASVQAPDNDGWPLAFPWRGYDIPSGHILHQVRAQETRTQPSWWVTPWGDRQNYYLDAVAGQRRIHTVLAVNDLWHTTQFHADDGPQTIARPQSTLECSCGYHGTVRGYPCPTCRQPFCPKCRECQCSRQDNRLVACPNPNCFMKVLPHQIHEDHCVNCE